MTYEELKHNLAKFGLYTRLNDYKVQICSNERAGATIGEISRIRIGNYSIYALINFEAAKIVTEFAYTEIQERKIE